MYYFNHSLIFNGGTKQSLGIKLDEMAFFIRLNTIVPINDEVWLVYLDEGIFKKTIIGGVYSDEIEIDNQNDNMKIKITRYYKNEEIIRQ